MCEAIFPIRASLVRLMFVALLIFCNLQPALAASVEAWRAEWERVLQAAKKEGEVTFYGSSGYEQVFREYHKRYPEIKVNASTGLRGSDYGQRIMTERRAGKYMVDLFINGAVTPNRVFLPAKALDPVRPVLILPEVLDESKWWGGKHHFADPEGKYIFVFQGNIHGAENAYNTKLVDRKEFNSYRDFLDPKWKGKMVAYDPKAVSTVAHSLRFLYNHPELGPEFIKRFFNEMEVTLSRDQRQMMDWLAVGKFPIAFFITDVEEVAKRGLPVKMFDPSQFREGAFVGPSQGAVSLLNRSPHPNAAKVAINWLLSREGQMAYEKTFAEAGDYYESMREDIPKDLIPAPRRRSKGVKYIYAGRADWMDMGPVTKLIQEAMGEAKKK
ncbi:MAG: ABC transporter substrate-binding protein [Candidatus Binatia bacterium]